MKSFFIVACFALPSFVFAQSNYAPLNEDYYHLIDRYEIKTGKVIPDVFTTLKPYKRSAIVEFLDSAKQLDAYESDVDQFNFDYMMNDNWEWSNAETSNSKRPVLRHFYKKKSDFFSVHNDNFDLHVNPVVYFGRGKDFNDDGTLYMNTRGIEVRGMVDQKVGFYTYLTDNQMALPGYVHAEKNRYLVVPHEGFWKGFKEKTSEVDFLQARGYISYDISKSIALQLGHDKLFIGNGIRSLIFSDYAPPTMFFRGNVKVWKVNYLFQLNQMTADVTGNATGLTALPKGYPNKYNALHHVSINIGKKLNVGVFESVIFSADDSLGYDHLRLDYFNPIIFYRAIEQQNGSSDNVLLGLDFKWNVVRKLQLYGQFLLDEFVLSNIRAQNGWWGNKFGVQAGGKYIDAFGVSNLDLQGEINIVRPYTYTHGTNYGSYTHYRQPVAHPLGANFKEMIGVLRYQPLKRLSIAGKLMFIQTGRDGAGENWGGNIFINNNSKEKNFGNVVAQGVSNNIYYGSFAMSWQLIHNLFIDGDVLLRVSRSDLASYDKNSAITSLALRYNISKRLYEF